MAHRDRPSKKRGDAARAKRLNKADQQLEIVWDALDPPDISADRWEDLRKLILAVKAAINRG